MLAVARSIRKTRYSASFHRIRLLEATLEVMNRVLWVITTVEAEVVAAEVVTENVVVGPRMDSKGSRDGAPKTS